MSSPAFIFDSKIKLIVHREAGTLQVGYHKDVHREKLTPEPKGRSLIEPKKLEY